MSVGLIALLDDVIGIAKIAAASLDDVAAQAVKAGTKSAGVVIDDAAVTPRYVIGIAAERELAIVARIARGSLRNKLVILLPLALLLSAFAPWTITPLLMLGGAYLCYEGAEKVLEAVMPHEAHAHEAATEVAPAGARDAEDRKVAGAVKTDFILSAEIMAIALAAVAGSEFWTRAIVLALVGIAITAAVYGAVAIIVKADDVGLGLARRRGEAATDRMLRAIGRGVVLGMPHFLRLLSIVGTAAMLWVGGGIVLHGLEVLGFATPAHLVHDIADAAAAVSPALPGAVGWFVGALGAGLVGLALGALLIPVTGAVLAPIARAFAGLIRRGPAAGH